MVLFLCVTRNPKNSYKQITCKRSLFLFLHMVLRAFQVESNGGLISLQDFHETKDTDLYNDIVALDYTKPKFTLSQNEPNPFSDYTKIRFSISNSGDKLCEHIFIGMISTKLFMQYFPIALLHLWR